MNRKLARIFLCVPGIIGLAYGTFTMLFHTATVRADATCCQYTSNCPGSGNYCLLGTTCNVAGSNSEWVYLCSKTNAN